MTLYLGWLKSQSSVVWLTIKQLINYTYTYTSYSDIIRVVDRNYIFLKISIIQFSSL